MELFLLLLLPSLLCVCVSWCVSSVPPIPVSGVVMAPSVVSVCFAASVWLPHCSLLWLFFWRVNFILVKFSWFPLTASMQCLTDPFSFVFLSLVFSNKTMNIQHWASFRTCKGAPVVFSNFLFFFKGSKRQLQNGVNRKTFRLFPFLILCRFLLWFKLTLVLKQKIKTSVEAPIPSGMFSGLK